MVFAELDAADHAYDWNCLMSDLLRSAAWPYSDSAAPEAVAGEKDACGVGFLAQLQGQASHWGAAGAAGSGLHGAPWRLRW